MKQTILSVLLSLFFVVTSFAQNNIFNHRRDLLNEKTSSFHFLETNPPIGELRFVAEFEPMQGVMIRYPLGIPESLVADFANNCHVYCIVMDSCQNDAYQTFVDVGVDMNRVTFVNAPTDDFFIRDYGPWYIFEDKEPAIVDNLYYPEWRPKDDSIPFVFSDFWNIPIYETNLFYEGGNMMEDGRGQGVSDDNVLLLNNNDEEDFRNKMRDYLGIDPIHLISPNYYYAHVDCWGKYLAPDIVLIAKMPESSSLYLYFEEVATYFANSNCCWGYPYRVYRVDIPDNGWNTVAPYTNSLILNKTVYVPVLNDSILDQDAIAVYQEAMPGYDIVAVEGCENTPWQPGDALHCRTRGVMDFNMLFVDHRNVLHGEQEWQDSIPVVSKFIAYSGADLKQDSLLVYYSIDGGAYQVAHMTATGNPDEYVSYIKGYQGESEIDYYVFGADESGHRYTQPVFADLDPHHFTMEAHEPTPQSELVITPDTLWFETVGEQYFNVKNETNEAVTVTITSYNGNYIWNISPLNFTLQPNESRNVEVTVEYEPGMKGYITTPINLSTSLGDRQVIVNINEEAWDLGLLMFPTHGLEFSQYDPLTQSFTICNSNALQSITINNVVEYGSDFFEMALQHDLPYELAAGESFRVTLTLVHFPQETTSATFRIYNSYGNGFKSYVAGIHGFNGVTELSAETKLYPNPTTGQFTVEGANVAKVEVYNLVGQKVCEQQGSKVVNINATDWNKGIYLVNIIDENGAVVTKKLVVR